MAIMPTTSDRDVVIVAAVRTPIGAIRGSLATVRPDDLAALVIREVVARSGVPATEIEEVIFGCANQAGEDNRNVARMAALLAGLLETVAGVTVNRLCASGLAAVNMAARAIRNGDGDVYVVGGVESMTRAPLSMPKGSAAFANGNVTAYDTTLGWRYPNPAMEALFPLEAMGETAENIVERSREGAYAGGEITREQQDAFALESQRRAMAAINAGRFKDEIVPVTVKGRKGDVVVNTDEGPRSDTSEETLGKLKPAFKKDGSVTAGNAPGLNDGAASVMVVSEELAQAHGLTPLAEIVDYASGGLAPEWVMMTPVPATRKLLKKMNIEAGDVDLWELNEAFSVQSLAVARELGLDPERVNVNGGAVALGHPIGASGARILVTLLSALKQQDRELGVATLCMGGGNGLALAVRRLG